MKVYEIFNSIQGESTYSGFPTVFIRFSECNLRCSYCDTKYSYYKYSELTVDQILKKILEFHSKYICLTGGEPLLQKIDIIKLSKKLIKLGKKVSIETNGSISIEGIPKEVKVVLDIKTPSSDMSDKNLLKNLDILPKNSDIKFVCGDREDFDYSLKIIENHHLEGRVNIIFSSIFEKLKPETFVNWILESKLTDVKFQLQIHKYIWNPNKKGV